MSNLSNTSHEIYKKRGRMNLQILFVLLAFVVLVMAATMAKLATGQSVGKPNSAVDVENRANQIEAGQ